MSSERRKPTLAKNDLNESFDLFKSLPDKGEVRIWRRQDQALVWINLEGCDKDNAGEDDKKWFLDGVLALFDLPHLNRIGQDLYSFLAPSRWWEQPEETP